MVIDMHVLVTGGAGFIGSHLAEELVKKKYKVIVIDNLSTGNLKNLRFIKNKIKFIKLDLSKKIKLKKELNEVKIIFHLAGLSKTLESIKKPKKYYNANVRSTFNLYNYFKNKKIKKFIYSASASCYGNPRSIPISEKTKINALSPYARTKWKAEKFIIEKSIKEKFPAISLRLFNVYGPRSLATSSYSSVISIFLKQKTKNRPLTIVGDGLQTRDFIYVTDVVNAMIKAAESKISRKIFNVGIQKSINIKKLAKIFSKKIKYVPKRKAESRHSLANIKKIKKLLKWKPKISIVYGIKKLIKEYSKINFL